MGTKTGQLTPKQAKFAILRARGYSKSAAYREAFNASRSKPHTVAEEARRLSNIPLVSRTIDEHLQASRLEDITTTRQIMRGMLDDLEEARDLKNMTAVAALNKTICQVYQMTSQRLVLSPEKSESDESLIARLSGGDPVLEKHLRAIIGRGTFGNGEKDDEKDE